MSIEKVKTYLTSSVNSPFFYFVGDSRYQDIKEKFAELGILHRQSKRLLSK